VSIGRQGGVADSIPFIDLQSTATAHLLLNHLWEQGRRRIALVQSSAARDSYASHKKAYENFAARIDIGRCAAFFAPQAASPDCLKGVFT
jgi:DNA-binding LacI/PurR family transcriptional regulator